MSCLDYQIGRLLDALEKSQHKDNTVVVLLSDQGHALGQKGRLNKFSLWEVSTRVPLIIRVPGLEAGTRCGQPVELLDMYPTLVDICSLRTTYQNREGLSLKPQLNDVGAKRNRPAITTFYYKSHAVRSENWRYIRYADGSEELYDHRSDPNEWYNLANNPDYGDIVREHQKHLPKENALPLKNSYYPWYSREETEGINRMSGLT